MKAIFRRTQNHCVRIKTSNNKRAYWAAIYLASLACGGTAVAQTNNLAQTNNPPATADSGASTNATKLTDVDVISHLDAARTSILPSLGATTTSFSADQIQAISQGGNAPFNEVILRAPGVAQDSAANGDLHVRGEHANLQYRINDVLLPEGITGFGLELDPRFVKSMQLITGSLPAQYGFRTAGVVDIQTKSGAFENGGTVEMFGGSHDTVRPSFELGGSQGNFNYFVDGSYLYNTLGIENPTDSHDAIHDETHQGRLFSYMSWLLDDTSRLSLMLSGSYSTFQVPNTAGLPVGTSPDGSTPWNVAGSGLPANFDSANLNENQKEQNYYAVLTYQKSVGDLNFQVSGFGRNSSVHFTPDQTGDLYFNGVASDVDRMLNSGGLQADGSYQLNEKHTVRAGALFVGESVRENSQTTVFPVDGAGNPTGPAFTIPDNNNLYGLFSGVYIQDEWKIFPKVTLNYGVRFDDFASSFDNESQLSPRVNLIYQPTDATTLHAGYSRYFTPPPVENVSGGTVSKFDGTSNASGTDQDDPVKAERANYYDVGISQKITKGLQVGVDGYYKTAKNQLDDGLFGQTLILSAFNYAEGRIWGTEFTVNYTQGGFSTYANIAYSVAEGKEWNSAQFLFDPADAAYVQNHWIYLDHDQRVTGSFGASYQFKESERSGTRMYVDALYGSGLRTDATAADGSNIPNGGTVPSYYSVNVGAEQAFKINKTQSLKARLDVVNITDNSYELRDGTGVGVNAAQYGARIGFFGSLSYSF
jgi:outer membrane receptor protein involved in Fe transport